MAGFIDRVVNIIESTPKENKEAAQDRPKIARRVARSTTR
jgi:hypothetical protein